MTGSTHRHSLSQAAARETPSLIRPSTAPAEAPGQAPGGMATAKNGAVAGGMAQPSLTMPPEDTCHRRIAAERLDAADTPAKWRYRFDLDLLQALVELGALHEPVSENLKRGGVLSQAIVGTGYAQRTCLKRLRQILPKVWSHAAHAALVAELRTRSAHESPHNPSDTAKEDLSHA